MSKKGTNKCVQEFYMNKSMQCIIMLGSGNLTLNRCMLSLDGIAAHINEKVPCVSALHDSSITIKNGFLFGDSTSEVYTAGFVTIEPRQVMISDTVFKNHKGGAIIWNMYSESILELYNNKILACQTAGIYIEGEGCRPIIESNEILNCRSTGIKIDEFVDADVRENKLLDNNDSIHIKNNKSVVMNNEIDKSHGVGIKVECSYKEAKCNAKIQGNSVSNCKLHGIQVSGKGCHAVISSNTIKNNRKWGIKIIERARVEINAGNLIKNNYNQGICIEEGSSGRISDNTISKNLKANIALGGDGSQQTRIERNEISGSVAEGIFLVEGRAQTSIYENIIKENLDGISLYNSKGKIQQNIIGKI